MLVCLATHPFGTPGTELRKSWEERVAYEGCRLILMRISHRRFLHRRLTSHKRRDESGQKLGYRVCDSPGSD